MANYSLYDYATGEMNLLGATFNSGNASAKLQADGKTVIITFSGSISNGKGFVAGGLTNGKYLLYVDQSETDKIQDLAATPNKVITNTNFEFTGTTTPAAGSIQVLSAEYTKAAKTLSLTFTEPANDTSSQIDASKISLQDASGNVAALKGATYSAGTGSTTVTLNLSAMATDDYAKVAALTGDLQVVVADGAYNDMNGNAAKGNTVSATQIALPTITASAYNTDTNVLTLTFDQPIDSSKITSLTGITIAGKDAATGSSVKSVNGNVVEIQVATALADGSKSADRTSLIDGQVDSKVTGKLDVATYVPANLFTATNTKQNVVTTIAKTTITQDATAPVISGISITDLNATGGSEAGTIKLSFSEPVSTTVADWTGANIKFYASDDLTTAIGTLNDGTLTQAALGTTAYAKDVTIDLSKYTTKATLVGELNTKITAGKSIVAVFAKDSVKDENAVGIAEVKTDSAIPVKVLTTTAPDNFKATPINPTTVKLEIQKTATDVDMKLASVTNPANYTVQLVANPNIKVTPSSVEYLNKKVILHFANALEVGSAYKLIVNNDLLTASDVTVAKDTINADTDLAFTSASADTTAPSIASATTVTDVNKDGKLNAGDKITVTFDEPIVLNGVKASDFELWTVAATAVKTTDTLGNSTVAVNPDNSYQLIITVGDTSTAKIGEQLVLNASTTKTLSDAAGNGVNILKVDNATPQNNALVSPDTTKPAIKTAVYADANNNGKVDKGDTLTLKFTQNLDQTVNISALAKTNFTVDDAASSGSGANLDLDTFTAAYTDADTVTLTFTGNVDLTKGATNSGYLDSAYISAKDTITNTWGTAANGSGSLVKITSADTTAPAITGAKYLSDYDYANGKLAAGTDKVIEVSFSKAVINGITLDDAAVDAILAVTNSTDYNLGTGYAAKVVDGKLYIKLGSSAVIDKGITKLNIKAGGATGLYDASGNAAIRNSSTPDGVTIQ